MNRTVNLRAFLILAVSIPALLVGVHFLHAFQMRRGAADLLARADQAEAEGRPAETRELLHDYLKLEPDHVKEQVRYGHSLKEAARNRDEYVQAYKALKRALELDPEQADLRREVASLAADLGLFSEAKENAEALRAKFPEDGQAECVLGRYAAVAGQPDEAVRWFEAAERHAPQREDAYLHHARILREKRSAAAADEVIRRMVAANPASVPARLAAARYFTHRALWEDAAREVAFVVGKPGADSADVYVLAAAVDEARSRPDPARGRITEGLRKHPAEPTLNLAAARYDLLAGKRDDALVSLKKVADAADVPPSQLVNLGDLYLDLDDVKSAEAVAERLNAAKIPNAARLQARLRIRKGEWGEARVLLEHLRGAALPPVEARQVEYLLASCYERLDDPEAALTAYRRALQFDPSWLPACRGEIAVLLSLGRWDDAELAYRKALPLRPELSLGFAQLLLTRQLRRPAGERQWAAFEAVMARLPEAQAKSPEARRFRAEYLSATGKADDARRKLEAQRDEHPEQVGNWLALARYALLQGDHKGAGQVLSEAETRLGRDPSLVLARIELVLRGDPGEAKKALAGIEPAVEKLTGEDQLRVLRGLAEAYFNRGDQQRAVALWRRIVEKVPQDLDVRLRLLEMAYRAGDTDAMGQQLAELRKIEGPGGSLTAWGDAARRVLLAEKGDKSQLAEAHRRLNDARNHRPRWSPIPLLEARMAILEGNADKAADQFLQAVRFGDRDPAVIRTAVDGLYHRRRYAEARDLLRDCADQTLATPDLGRRAAELTLLQADGEGSRRQALEQARKTVSSDSKDPRDYQWLAQIARAAGENAEAEKLLRKALSLSDKSPDLWLSLISLLAPVDAKKAEAALGEARGKLSADDAPFVLGAAYEVLGQADKAREQYDGLLTAKPSDPAALQVAADFYSRRGPLAKAESCLRRLLDPAVKVPDAVRSAARRELAVTVAAPGSYAKFKEALELLDAAAQPPSREDQLTRALLFASRPEKRREARALLEKLAKESPLPADAQFLQIRLADADGDTARADDRMLSLLGTDGKNPAVIAWHVQSLIRRGQLQSARPWLDALRTLEPDSLRTVTLLARVAADDGHKEEAARLLTDFLAKHPERRLNVAGALEEVGATAEAEKLLREEARGARPEGVLVLAEYLSRHQQLAEALTLCAGAWKTCPPNVVAAASLSAVRAGNGGSAEMAALADRFAAESARHPDSLELLQARAELAELRGRFDEALALYKDILDRNRDFVPALNNRAWLLALKDAPGEEAKSLIGRVLDRTGPIANYLDTRAMAHLAAGETSPAVADMEEAIRQEPAAPYYLHLAQARLQAGDRTAAVTALQEGKKRGLRPEIVHPLEQDRCRRMLAELDKQ